MTTLHRHEQKRKRAVHNASRAFYAKNARRERYWRRVTRKNAVPFIKLLNEKYLLPKGQKIVVKGY